MKALLTILALLTGLLHAQASFAAADTLANEDLQHGELNTNAVRIEASPSDPHRERPPAPAKRAEPAVRTSQPKPARVAPRPAGEPRNQSLLPER